MKNFAPVPNKDWEFLFNYDKIHPKYRIIFFVFRYMYGYKENREKGYFTVKKLQDLADYLKMHRKMLWKYLKQLEEEGVIWRKGKRIGIGKWSAIYRYVPERVTREKMMGPVVVSERVTEFPRYLEKNVPYGATNNLDDDEFVPIRGTNPTGTKKEEYPVNPDSIGTKPNSDIFNYRKEIQNFPPNMDDDLDIDDDEEDFSSWTEKEIFGKFYPYRRFFPDDIDHPEKVDEFFINAILPEITKHFPGYAFSPASPNLKALFREYEKILRLKTQSPHQTKITI